MFNQIRSLRNKSTPSNQACVKNTDGAVISEPSIIMNRWREYGASLFESPDGETPLTKMNRAFDDDMEPPPLMDEVMYAVKKLKDGKSPGLDEIPAELIKSTGQHGIKALHQLCTCIWIKCDWPNDWKAQEFVMLFKSGDRKQCSNYRTIALISHTSKVLLMIIILRLKAKLDQELPEEQAAYRKGRGTVDMLVCLQILMEKIIAIGQKAFIMFIDYSKAFDSVSHIKLFSAMIEMGFPAHLVALLQSLYVNQKARIRWNGENTDEFNLGKGVRQGCIASPHMFVSYTEKVMRDADVNQYGIKVGGTPISNLRYADDTALFETSEEDIERLTSAVNDAGRKLNLKLNVKKTKLLTTGDEQPVHNISIDGEDVEQVSRFKYLGSVKTTSASCTADIRARIGMAKGRMIELQDLWNDRNLTTNLKTKIVKALVWSVLLYGLEGWTLIKADENRIMAAEMWIWRRMLRVNWKEKRTNISILKELGVKRQLLGELIKRELSYFWHIKAIT